MEAVSGVYHPGRSATLRLGPKTILAEFGELHPATVKAFDMDGPVIAAEIFLDAIPVRRGGSNHMREAYAPPALQAVRRDFAFLVAADKPADDVLRAVRGADKEAIQAVKLFDIFTGQGVPEGEKSVAIEVVLQPTDKSFTDAELQAISDRVVKAAEKAGARLRG
jgi:phenylalanyl-tRNA synthetase beta chain